MSDQPRIEVPLERWAEQLATRTAEKVARAMLEEHIKHCPLADLPGRVDALEKRERSTALGLARMVGLVLGSSGIGSLIGAFVAGGLS